MEKGEIIEENNRKVRKIEAVLLLCLTSILQPAWLGRPYQEYKNSSKQSYPVNEVRNPPTTKR